MHFILKLGLRLAFTAAAMYGLQWYFPSGFIVSADPKTFLGVAGLIVLVHTVLRPILKLISFPLLLLTLGLFNIVINLALLLLVDYYSTALTISGWKTALISSIILGIANSLF
ncbi:MAG: hypothetical protein UY71_C0043G0009 [Parcubacteria group bacterium GW2011_GWB1_52_7]|nr:MAG: hypothetical protein UY64_C0029G0006 [Parcubacteria group bacterium GW2011_GWA1_51_12]KKW27500.1 MAG: hypothetical protein UY71_C0043G0009 [Parcubacteria group bacterium GW2011_GWB1_52_7]KKW31247.1 MAG: hypothetical protein UY75_C0012G0002 [Parcubacteria group bacterium GW2011_GWC2_52_8c]